MLKILPEALYPKSRGVVCYKHIFLEEKEVGGGGGGGKINARKISNVMVAFITDL